MWRAFAVFLFLPLVASAAPPCASEKSCRAACDAGTGAACTELAFLIGDGDGEDAQTGRNLFDRACALRDAEGCAEWGLQHDGDEASESEWREATRLYQRACTLGSVAGCRYLAYMLETARGVTRHDRLAIVLYQRACDGGEGVACTNLSHMINDGRGAPKDDARVLALLVKGCDGKDAEACHLLAEKKPDDAVALEQKACHLGRDASCPE